jgi:multicomponent Na+:H+ antiporter subunit D
VSQLQLLLFSGLAFFLMLGWLRRTLTITLDVDWLWRRLGPQVLGGAAVAIAAAWAAAARLVEREVARLLGRLDRTYREGRLSRPQASGSMALVALAVLALYLAIQFLR